VQYRFSSQLIGSYSSRASALGVYFPERPREIYLFNMIVLSINHADERDMRDKFDLKTSQFENAFFKLIISSSYRPTGHLYVVLSYRTVAKRGYLYHITVRYILQYYFVGVTDRHHVMCNFSLWLYMTCASIFEPH